MSDIIIFEADAQQVEVRLEGETLWLSLQQLADLFGRDKSVISRHLKNIFETSELQREAVVAKNAATAADGKVHQVMYLNLDAFISVGYPDKLRPGYPFPPVGHPYIVESPATAEYLEQPPGWVSMYACTNRG